MKCVGVEFKKGVWFEDVEFLYRLFLVLVLTSSFYIYGIWDYITKKVHVPGASSIVPETSTPSIAGSSSFSPNVSSLPFK